ncbi:YD repeat protein [Candidatus Vecturithrix granuli]|uniref:YD repeat protein n=1 Tax=Vecturithrix granuli TaxID=1499967 RepID=A0A081BTX2_VECG1|nr:YD repeat protein [Candidatus Vecturithrix granuli]
MTQGKQGWTLGLFLALLCLTSQHGFAAGYWKTTIFISDHLINETTKYTHQTGCWGLACWDGEYPITPRCEGDQSHYEYTEPTLRDPYPLDPPEEFHASGTPVPGISYLESVTYTLQISECSRLWMREGDCDRTVLQTCPSKYTGSDQQFVECSNECAGYEETTTWKEWVEETPTPTPTPTPEPTPTPAPTFTPEPTTTPLEQWTPRPFSPLGDPGRNKGEPDADPQDACGSPIWSVNMVNLNLYVKDVPLWYNPALGPSVSLVLSYNSQANVTEDVGPVGRKWQMAYSSYIERESDGSVIVVMPDGRQERYTLEDSGAYQPPYHVWNTLTKHSDTEFTLRFPDDSLFLYRVPDGASLSQPVLTGMQDAHGHQLTLAYTTDGHVSSITDALNQTTTFSYTDDGLLEAVEDPFGRRATLAYDEDRRLSQITDMGGYWTRFSYDDQSYLTALQNARGTWEFAIEPADGETSGVMSYPAPGMAMGENYRLTVTDPLGGRTEYYYESVSGESWYVSPRDYVEYESPSHNNAADDVPKTRYTFTNVSAATRIGEIAQVTSPEGDTITYSYDDDGNRRSVTTTLGTTTYTYNEQGRITSVTDAKGQMTTLSYAANGVDLERIDNGLGTLTLTYNDAHDVTAITDRLGHTTSFSYHDDGQLASQRDALGGLSAYVYDPKGRLSQVTRDGQVIAEFTYDALGRVDTATDATGLTLTYTYNDLNHITAVTYPDGRSESYTYSGCCPRLVDRATDRAGRATEFTYDALKRLISSTNPEGGVTQYAYDSNGNLIQLTNPEQQVTTFDYDLDNRVIQKSYANGDTVNWEYNDAGLVARATNARGTAANYSYDANGNLTAISYDDETPDVNYSYDAYDRITQMTDGLGTWGYSYDTNAQLTGVDGPWEADALSYEYDALGQRTRVQPESGTPLTYLYDTFHRLTEIQVGTADNAYTYSYTGVNPLVQQLTRPNGSATTYQYNALNQLTEILNRASSGEVLSRHIYTYNDQDLRDSETREGTAILPEPDAAETKTAYTHNEANQLLTTTDPDAAYTYDADGNLTQGYTKDDDVFTAEYDAENRLTSLEYTDSSGVLYRQEFRYSGDNLLAEQKVYENGVLVDTLRIVRDGMLALQDRDGENAIVREYTWGLHLGGGIGGLLNLKQDDADYAYLYDGKGNVEVVLNASQNVAAAYRYDPFGVLLNQTGSLNQPFGFSTKRTDARTGMVFYQYRPYGPEIGKWFTRDRLGETGGINLYAFVGNNPINWIDPWGLTRIIAPLNVDSIVQLNGRLRGYVDFLPDWLLDMLLPVDPEVLFTDAILNLMCPFSIEWDDLAEIPLKRIHTDELLETGSRKYSLDFWRKQSTEDIIESLKPGYKESLKVKPDGRIFNGNTRIKVLEERGYPINSLPREILE